MGLLDELAKYVKDALPGGLLNREVAGLPGLLNTQADATSDAIRSRGQSFKRALDNPTNATAQEALQAGLDLAGMANLGMTAWHGSPYKFDKFDLSKIGTGEGAQAYGHGAYLGEAKAVGQEYMRNLAGKENGMEGQIAANALRGRTQEQALELLKDNVGRGTQENRQIVQKAIDLIEQGKANTGYLYKTDIPDEAVARFLDWDKPLSQQAPEVYEAIRQMYMQKKITVPSSGPVGSMVHDLGMNLGAAGDASKYLASQGIQGIRYLDGGSRGAGKRSSNFVVFDPEMIRILERNGQSTGQVPWNPGEYQGLLAK